MALFNWWVLLVIKGEIALYPHYCSCLFRMLFYTILMRRTRSPRESFSKHGEIYYLFMSGVMDDSLDAVVLMPSGQAF